jgi:hypothetical protein
MKGGLSFWPFSVFQKCVIPQLRYVPSRPCVA